MIGGLSKALEKLLTGSLPTLFTGPANSTVGLTISGGPLQMDGAQAADTTAGEPRPDDREDVLAFDPADPGGPYALAQPPYPGPRRVWLVMGAGERTALGSDEIIWDETDARRFSLRLRSQRDVSSVTAVRVLYGVTAIYTKIKAAQTLNLRLTTLDADLLERAETLAVAVIQLNRQRLVDDARASYEDGAYDAVVELKNLSLVQGTRTAVDTRLLTLRADLELKAGRALGEGEGVPIKRVLTPGRSSGPDRPVDVYVEVEG